MDYPTLIAAKTVNGSIQSWVGYSRLDPVTTVDEAQALLYQLLRVREMRKLFTFGMAVGNSSVALPTGFLDPIGRMVSPGNNLSFRHKDQGTITENRMFSTADGALGTNPFSTTMDSSLVTVAHTAHGLSQESVVIYAGLNGPVGGLSLNGGFPITDINDVNSYEIDAGDDAGSATTGGGSTVTFTANNLIQGSPNYWGLWDERIHFELAFSAVTSCQLPYFKSLPLLSVSNPTNFLTDRYPQLLRTACLVAASDFMKDDAEYAKASSRLSALVQSINAENDGMYRGMEIDAETP